MGLVERALRCAELRHYPLFMADNEGATCHRRASGHPMNIEILNFRLQTTVGILQAQFRRTRRNPPIRLLTAISTGRPDPTSRKTVQFLIEPPHHQSKLQHPTRLVLMYKAYLNPHLSTLQMILNRRWNHIQLYPLV